MHVCNALYCVALVCNDIVLFQFNSFTEGAGTVAREGYRRSSGNSG